MKKDESAASVRIEIEEVERSTVQARQAIGVYDNLPYQCNCSYSS